MNAEQQLLKFDKTKENIPRQITAAVCTRPIYPEVVKGYIADKAKNKDYDKIYSSPQKRFEMEGIQGYIEKTEDALIVAGSLARYRYSVDNAYISDIGAGLHSMVTLQNKGLFEWYELQSISMTTGIIEKTGARIVLSTDTLRKAMFGSLVDHNGRAIHGAGDIVGDAWEKIQPILDGKVPMPRAYASIRKNIYQANEKGKLIKDKKGNYIFDRTIEALVEGEPIRVYRKMSGARDALIIDLDYFFFPAVESNGELKMKEQYLHQVAGLTSFLQLGSKIQSKGKKQGIDVLNARKIILAAQAAFELWTFAPGIVKVNQSGRYNISLRRSAVGDLYPSAVDHRGNIRFKDFSDAVSLAGQYFNNAIEATGIKNELLKHKNILFPATDRGAEFPKEYPQIVYIKADKVK